MLLLIPQMTARDGEISNSSKETKRDGSLQWKVYGAYAKIAGIDPESEFPMETAALMVYKALDCLRRTLRLKGLVPFAQNQLIPFNAELLIKC